MGNNMVKKEILYDIHNFGINPVSRVIYLNGDLDNGEDGGYVDFRCTVGLVKNLDYLECISKDPITINMCLAGGDTSYGFAIFDRIKQSECYITINCYAHASSMSGIILEAADYRRMAKSAHFLLHFGSLSVDGNSSDVAEAVKFNDKENQIMLGIFAEKCMKGKSFEGWTLNKVTKHLEAAIRKKGDLYLDANQSLEWGLIDEII